MAGSVTTVSRVVISRVSAGRIKRTTAMGVTMSYGDFCRIAKQARTTRDHNDVHALVVAYAAMQCAAYPQDVALMSSVYGDTAPAGYTFRPCLASSGASLLVEVSR